MIQANSLNIPLKDESVQCIVTSPAYWGLRDYSVNGQLGLEKTPEEYVENTVKWAREVWRVLRSDGCFWLNLGDSYAGSGKAQGQKPDSTNMGKKQKDRPYDVITWTSVPDGLKPKDLCEIPSDVVRALRADGWWLRSRLPWVKRSSMPESCTDRPASALEYMFLLTKSSNYFFDMESIRKESAPSGWDRQRKKGVNTWVYNNTEDRNISAGNGNNAGTLPCESGRNFRNTDLFYQSLEEPHGAIFCGEEMVGLDVNPQAFDMEMCKKCQEVYFGKEYRKLKSHVEIKDGKKVEYRICKICKMWDKWLSHFATFPEWLVTPLIKSGTSERGACPECSAPWQRVVENETDWEDRKNNGEPMRHGLDGAAACGAGNFKNNSKTIGWQPTCKCGHKETVPCIVLDPFAGSFTTKSVAQRLGRKSIGLELKWEYIQMGKKRCYQLPSLFN